MVHIRSSLTVAATVLLVGGLTSRIGWSATIRFEDDTTVEGDIVRLKDDTVLISVPRASITTIDGQPLPPVLTDGSLAPPFTVHDITGQRQTVGQPHSKGSGPITMLHFWVQWCPHCRADVPALQQLHEQFRDHPKVRFIAVNMDKERAALDTFLAKQPVPYPVVFAAEQAQGPQGIDLPELYQITGFPVTYLIDGQGVIREKLVGSFVESRIDLGAKITALLPQSPPSPTASP